MDPTDVSNRLDKGTKAVHWGKDSLSTNGAEEPISIGKNKPTNTPPRSKVSNFIQKLTQNESWIYM